MIKKSFFGSLVKNLARSATSPLNWAFSAGFKTLEGAPKDKLSRFAMSSEYKQRLKRMNPYKYGRHSA